MRTFFQIVLFLVLSLNCQAAIVPIQRNVFTTNTFDTAIVGGAIPYFDYPSGKFIATGTVYTNGFLFEPTLGTFSVFHTNITGDLMLVLQEGGPAGPSIQGYSDKLVVANTNLTFDAVGPFSIRLRVDGSNVLEAVAGSILLSGKTNQVADNGSSLTYNGGSILQPFYYGGQYGFGANDITPTNIRSGILTTGNIDLFTVPIGKRFLASSIAATTTNLSATTAYSQLKTNGVYYRMSANLTPITNSTALLGGPSAGFFFFEAGETVAVNITLAGVNVTTSGLLFSTNIPAYTPRLLTMAATDVAIYTCPAGKCAVNLPLNSVNVGTPFLQGNYFNDSGSTRTIVVHAVPFGGVPDDSNIIMTRQVSDKTTAGIVGPGVLFPGYSIVIRSDATTAVQWAEYTVAEIPFP